MATNHRTFLVLAGGGGGGGGLVDQETCPLRLFVPFAVGARVLLLKFLKHDTWLSTDRFEWNKTYLYLKTSGYLSFQTIFYFTHLLLFGKILTFYGGTLKKVSHFLMAANSRIVTHVVALSPRHQHTSTCRPTIELIKLLRHARPTYGTTGLAESQRPRNVLEKTLFTSLRPKNWPFWAFIKLI